jgi:FKBP-type peptidyl-prolyl cis-trans isomerase
MKIEKGNIGVIVSFLIVIVLIVSVVYSRMNLKEETPLVDTTPVVQEQVEQDKNPITVKDNQVTPKKSMEQIAKNGDLLVMNYTGRLTNGTVFDSNVDPKFNHVQPFEFTLGAGQVIAGWDEGLVGMKVGEKKTLTIAPEKAYGDRAMGPIPANSTLIFDVELVAIK